MRTFAIAIAFAGSVCVLPAAPLRAQEVDAGRVRSAVERALPPIQASLKAFEAGKNESLAQAPPRSRRRIARQAASPATTRDSA